MYLSFQNYISKNILDKLEIDFKVTDNIIKLKSQNIYFLEDYLKTQTNGIWYDLGMKAIQDIYLQILDYQDRGFTFLSFNLKEILVIDYNKFLLVPNEIYKVEVIEYKINLNSLRSPIEDSEYISPELRELNINEKYFPITICYYSIALIILKIVFNSTNLDNMNIIKHTDLYNILKRCLQKNPKHRFFVII